MKKMSALEKVRMLKQLQELNTKKRNTQGLALVKVLAEIQKIRRTLGFKSTLQPSESAVVNEIIQGKRKLSQETLNLVEKEAEKNPDNPKLTDALGVLVEEYNASYA